MGEEKIKTSYRLYSARSNMFANYTKGHKKENIFRTEKIRLNGRKKTPGN